MAIIHQTLTGTTSDYETGTWEFAVLDGMEDHVDCTVGARKPWSCYGTADDGVSPCGPLGISDGGAACPAGCVLTEDPCAMLAPAGLWQKATEADGSIRAPIECVPNFEVSYLRVAQPQSLP